MRQIIKIVFDGLFLSRPLLWVPVWGFVLFGLLATRGSLQRLDFWNASVHLTHQQLVGMMLFSCAVGSVYVINQLADMKVDSANSGFSLLGHAHLSVKLAVLSAIGLALVAVAVPLVYGDMILALLSAAALVVGGVYSCAPLRLSGRPILDFVSNAFGYGAIAFGVGWHLGGRALQDADFIVSAAPYLCLMAAGSISSTLPDIEGDRAEGKNTTAVVLGIPAAHAIATLFLVAAALIALHQSDRVAWCCALLSLPVYGAYMVVRTPWLMEATYKVGGALCMVAVAFYVPLFAFLSIVTLAATWLYFRVRFNVQYPALLPAHRHTDA
jgi:4-hydroxybenzoate polyprenyltransferase